MGLYFTKKWVPIGSLYQSLGVPNSFGVSAMFDRLKMRNTFSCGNYTYEDYGKAGPDVYVEMTSKWSNFMKNASKPN